MAREKILLVQAAALGWDLVSRSPRIGGLEFRPLEGLFPAVTCPVQATMRTASPPARHGMVMNGVYSPDLRRPWFWEQSSALVRGERIWSSFRRAGRTVGMLFWQQSLGEEVDMLLSPWPVHRHHGRMIDAVHSRPEGLYGELCSRLRSGFRLADYWGPHAGFRASEWIARAASEIMWMELAPDLLLVYLPHLDYDLQRFPPGHGKCTGNLEDLYRLLELLGGHARETGYQVVVYGDYAIGPAREVLYPNRTLLAAGLMRARRVRGMLYPDFHESRAFAVVDHEVAHVYVREDTAPQAVRDVLEHMPGSFEVLGRDARRELGMEHPGAGALTVAGAPGSWFAYPWWDRGRDGPDYAGHIDIHNKPGYDPCELFSGRMPFRVAANTGLVRGTHGVLGPGRRVAWASTMDLERDPGSILELSRLLKKRLDRSVS